MRIRQAGAATSRLRHVESLSSQLSPGGVGHSNRGDLRVDDEPYEAIQRIVEQDTRRVSDVVRGAMMSFAAPFDGSLR